MKWGKGLGLLGLVIIILGLVSLAFSPYAVSRTNDSTMIYDHELFYLLPGSTGSLIMAFPAFGSGSTFQNVEQIEVAITEGAVGVNYSLPINGTVVSVSTAQTVNSFNVKLLNGDKSVQSTVSNDNPSDFGPMWLFFGWPNGWNSMSSVEVTNPSDSAVVVSATAFLVYNTANAPNPSLYILGIALSIIGLFLIAASFILKRRPDGLSKTAAQTKSNP
jgi:hypothetical protein